jgi:hypothetical protein
VLGSFIPDHMRDLPTRRWIGDLYFIVLDCPDELQRARINARPSWRSHDIDKPVEFGRWLRRNIPNHVDTSGGNRKDTAVAITT